MDDNNTQLQTEVTETRQEFFKLENQKRTIVPGLYVPCEGALDLLNQLNEIDTEFDVEKSLDEEPEMSEVFNPDKTMQVEVFPCVDETQIKLPDGRALHLRKAI